VAQLTGSAMATTADAGTSTGGALLGQVLSTSVSGRLQKFFGVSRVKIDPRAIGLEGTPQAQLTVEQQISRDVTLTYVTNLQNNQQQIVRVEWNVNKRWSAVAVRDANGLFGVDFYYKKRLK
jgi:translocation and assembly module TamB